MAYKTPRAAMEEAAACCRLDATVSDSSQKPEVVEAVLRREARKPGGVGEQGERVGEK